MSSPFRKAEKRAVKLRAAIDGPTGAGKTISALKIARGLVGPKGRIAVIDTEHGTAEKFYARITDFDCVELTNHFPMDYVNLIKAAEDYDCLIIDSLSHAWTEGVLSMVDSKGGRFDAWKDVTPHHNALVKALLTFPNHLIVTIRTKMAYEVSKDEKTGKNTVEKLGLKPVQREGLEYEFDLVMDIDRAHRLTVSKSRIEELADRFIVEPGEEFGEQIAALIADGIPVVDTAALATELIEQSGDKDALVAAMKGAGISSADLADESKLAEARALVEQIIKDREAATAADAEKAKAKLKKMVEDAKAPTELVPEPESHRDPQAA